MCDELKNYIDHGADDPDNIDPQEIHEMLRKIFELIKFMKVSRDVAKSKEESDDLEIKIKTIDKSINQA